MLELKEMIHEAEARDLDVRVVRKVNIEKHGVMEKGKNPAPMLYLEDFIDEDTAEKAIDKIIEKLAHIDEINVEIPRNYDDVKGNLALKAIGFDANKDFLDDAIYQVVEDIALVVYVRVNENTSYKFGKSFAENLGVDSKEVLNDAILNTECSIRPLGDVIPGAEDLILIVSNGHQTFGASGLFAVGATKKLAERFSNGCYVLPSSIHEVLAVAADDGDPEQLKEMVMAINRTEVSPEDVLTDSVYFVSPDGEFKKVA